MATAMAAASSMPTLPPCVPAPTATRRHTRARAAAEKRPREAAAAAVPPAPGVKDVKPDVKALVKRERAFLEVHMQHPDSIARRAELGPCCVNKPRCRPGGRSDEVQRRAGGPGGFAGVSKGSRPTWRARPYLFGVTGDHITNDGATRQETAVIIADTITRVLWAIGIDAARAAKGCIATHIASINLWSTDADAGLSGIEDLVEGAVAGFAPSLDDEAVLATRARAEKKARKATTARPSRPDC
mmetsp:Transcript_17207/g.60472  ORF Transcript_17207/g.60472 Transcript_17207/m.60472 type:complete len:243 (+) Transcript_17207:1458-2186(+)